MDKVNSSYVEELQKIIEQQKLEISKLKTILNNIPGRIYWKDRNGKYLGASSGTIQILKKHKFIKEDDPNPLIGKTDHDIFPEEIADQLRKNDLNVLKKGEICSFTDEKITCDKQCIFEISTKCPLKDEKGNTIGIIGHTIDVTTSKKIAAYLKEAQKKLHYIVEQNKKILSRTGKQWHLDTPAYTTEYLQKLVEKQKAVLLNLKQQFPDLYSPCCYNCKYESKDGCTLPVHVHAAQLTKKLQCIAKKALNLLQQISKNKELNEENNI